MDEIVDLALDRRVPLRRVPRARLDAMARTDAPQGVIARAASVEEVSLAQLCDSSGGPPFLLVLDGVTDPHNLGALLRSADAAEATGAVLARHRAAHLSPSASKAAAGAVEHLPIAVVPGIASALEELAAAGVWSVGLDPAGERSLFELGLEREPVALVVGSEGKGLSRLVARRCDVVARIPQSPRAASLNVSAAGAIACFEVFRARHAGGTP